MQRDPDGIDVNAMSNLTTLCRVCHNWIHQRALPDAVPVTVTDADMTELTATSLEILQFLATDGPAGTSAVMEALTAELTPSAVREHLERLTALDNLVDAREEQLVDRDREMRVWGLSSQIEESARGHVPSDREKFAQRVEDEQVRRAIEAGHDRKTVADVLDVSPRSTYLKYKRAHAYEFPLAEFRRSGAGGQHPAAGAASDAGDGPMAESAMAADGDGDAGFDAEADEDLETSGNEAGSVRQADRGDDVGESDRDGGGSVADPVRFGEHDPELVRMVRETIIEQLSDE